MKTKMLFTYIVFAAFLFIACNPQAQAPTLLNEAQKLIDNQPDSALKLIDSIFYPEKSLEKRQYMEYIVTRVQARYKTYRDISDDTLIFEARDYFAQRKKEEKETALAYFYSGAVFREQKSYKQAMKEFKNACLVATERDDTDMLGLVHYNMGDLLAEQDLYAQALNQYKLAEQFYAELPEKQAQCNSAMGQMYMLSGNQNSALVAFEHGLDLAKNAEDNNLQSLLLQNISVFYTDVKQYEKAEEYLRKSFKLNSDTTENSRYYLNFAKIFSNTNQQDSALFYVDKLTKSLKNSTDIYFKASAYYFLSNWEKDRGNFDKAFFYKDEREKVFEQILKKVEEQSIYEVQQKYDFEQLQNQYNHKQINYQKSIILLLCFVIATGIAFSIHIMRKKNQLIRIQRRMDTLNRINSELLVSVEQNKQNLRNAMLQQLDVAKKIIHLNKEFNEGHVRNKALIEQVNHILYGERSVEQQWEVMFGTFNGIHPGLANKIKKEYDTLSEIEFRICLLTYAGFKVEEIALVLDYKPNTVQTLRTQIRKKIGATPGEDIASYLNRVL